jgi:hypothetical protein
MKTRGRFGQGIQAQTAYLGAVVVATGLAGWPLLEPRLMTGHDTLVHVPRTVEFSQGLASGLLVPRWAPDYVAGYGQPVFMFYPILFYYLSSAVHALGAGYIVAQNLACLGLLLVAALGMFLLAGSFFGPRGGLVAAVAYLFAPYTQVMLYVRHALFDLTAFAILPFAFWGLYRYVDGGRFRHLLVTAGSATLLLLSSNTVALMSFPALTLLACLMAAARRSWRALGRGALGLALGLSLAAFFWFPAIAELGFVNRNDLTDEYFDFRHHFVAPHQLLYSPWAYGHSSGGDQDGMTFEIGPVHLVMALVALVLGARSRRFSRGARLLVGFFLLLLLLAAVLTTQLSQLVWERLPLLEYLQFPWRFLSLVAISSALLCGVVFSSHLRPARANLLLALLVGALLLDGLPTARPKGFRDVTDADFVPESIAREGISAHGALPVWVQRRPRTPVSERLVFLVRDKGQVVESRLKPERQEFVVQVRDDAQVRLNTLYFPGWTVLVDGVETSIDYDNPLGVMEFSLEEGEHTVTLALGDTPARAWSKRMSLAALVVLLGLPFLRRFWSAAPFPLLAPRRSGQRSVPVA